MGSGYEASDRLSPHRPIFISRSRGWFGALLLLFGLAGCQAGNVGSISSGVQNQKSAAAFRNRLVSSSGGLYRNAAVSRELAEIGTRLSTAAGEGRVTILVLNMSIPNAYIAPGGYIYLTRGLLLLAKDDSEVAAVVAHEMAHILSGHDAARTHFAMQAAISSADIAGALPDSDRVRQLFVQGNARVASFSRQQELEADAMAIQLLAAAGYEPAAVARLLKAMQAVEATGSYGDAYGASHPLPSIRIEQAEMLAAGDPSGL